MFLRRRIMIMLLLLLVSRSRSAPSTPGTNIGPLNLARSFSVSGTVVELALDCAAGSIICSDARGNWDRKTAAFVTNISLNNVPSHQGNYLMAFAPPMGTPRNASPFSLTVSGAGVLSFRYKTSLDAGNDSELVAYLDGATPVCLWQASGCWRDADYLDNSDSWWDTAVLTLGPEHYTRQISFAITGPRRDDYEEWQPGAGKTLHRAAWLDHFVWTPAPDLADLVQFSPPPATAGTALALPQSLILSSPYASIKIHYTLDGQVPTARSPVYTTPLPLSRNVTVKAIALEAGEVINSKVYTAIYALAPPAPTLEPDCVIYTGAAILTFGSPLTNTQFFYSTDGTAPAHTGSIPVGSTRRGTGLTLTQNSTIRVLAWADGLADSHVTTRTVRVRPETVTIYPDGNLFTEPTDFTFSSSTPEVTFHYTLDGQIPTTTAPTGTSCRISQTNTQLQVIAVKANMEPTLVSSRLVTLRPPPPIISVRVDGGAASSPTSLIYYDETVEISLSSSPGTTLFYTLLGGTPQFLYTGPLDLTEVIHFACLSRLDGYTDSETMVLEFQQRPALETWEFTAGWNLFALPGDISPDASACLVQALTPFAFTENFSGYSLVDTLEFGQGYWVFRAIAGPFVPARTIRYTPRHEAVLRPGWHWQLSGAPFPLDRPVWHWQNGNFQRSDPTQPAPVAGWLQRN